jgi:hypothetical protein
MRHHLAVELQLILLQGQQTVEQREEIDFADGIPSLGRLKRQRGLRDDRVAKDRDQPLRTLGLHKRILDLKQDVLPGGGEIFARAS